MKRLILIVAAAIAFSGAAAGQTELPKEISGGILNGKATSLPKPAYPPAARAVNAEGAVSVQVIIDEQGNVVSATAVSGHPLLRTAAVEAAERATFSPTLLSGNPVRVRGVITYNFVGTVTPGIIAYELAYAERTGRFGQYTSSRSLASRLPETLAAERLILESLTFEREDTPPDAIVRPEPNVKAADANKFTVRGSTNIYAQGPLTRDSVEKVRSLLDDLEARLAADPRVHWNFRLGRTLGKFAAEISDDNSLAANAAELERIAASAPSELPAEAVERVRALAAAALSGDIGPDKRQELLRTAQELRNIRLVKW